MRVWENLKSFLFFSVYVLALQVFLAIGGTFLYLFLSLALLFALWNIVKAIREEPEYEQNSYEFETGAGENEH